MANAVRTRADLRLKPRGVHFPFMKRSDGLPSADSPPDIYVSNIKQIIMTMFGERVMRPTFGCSLKKLLFAPITPGLESAVKQVIQMSVAVWEPRVVISSIDVKLMNSTVRVRINFVSPVGQGQLNFTMENQ